MSLHERVREADLGPVDGAVARAFDDAEHIVVFRVEDYALGCGLALIKSALLLLSSLRDPSAARGVSSGADLEALQRGGHDASAMRRRRGGVAAVDGTGRSGGRERSRVGVYRRG